jgi:hypothetical protein
MGSLVKDIGHSEVNATLELLDRYGVSVDGLKRLRTKVSPAIIKQLVRFIEVGTVSRSTALSAFTTVNAQIGYPELDQIESQWSLRPKRHIDNLPVRGLGILLPKLPPKKERLIIMEIRDFESKPISPSLGQLTCPQWLQRWSEENLIGFNLELCRKDTAPYLVELRGTVWGRGQLWVATEPLQSSGPKTMLRLEDCENGVLRLKLMEYKYSDSIYAGFHMVYRIVER